MLRFLDDGETPAKKTKKEKKKKKKKEEEVKQSDGEEMDTSAAVRKIPFSHHPRWGEWVKYGYYMEQYFHVTLLLSVY